MGLVAGVQDQLIVLNLQIQAAFEFHNLPVDHRSNSPDPFDQPFPLQVGESVADNCAADADPFGELHFGGQTFCLGVDSLLELPDQQGADLGGHEVSPQVGQMILCHVDNFLF